ncbi:MAG: ABC transporter ATP-binding protein [Actinomycetes bacterium]
MSNEVILEVTGLRVDFATEDGVVHAVDDVTYSVSRGKTLAIVGESGSGKSVSSLAVMGLIQGLNAEISGSVKFAGQELIGVNPEVVRKLRGSRIAMIFQDPLSALHPFYTIGMQLVEAVQVHNAVSDEEAYERSKAMLERVGIASVEQRMTEFPHQLSGGMRQRVMIAMALINEPELLIADEPTTALDVTVQAQILDLLRDLQKEFGTAIVLITHDLGVVADLADDVMVMYGGSAVEQAPVRELFYEPAMPYTWGLLASIPQVQEKRTHLDPIPGLPPSLIHLPKGCVFAPRCVFKDHVADNLCATTRPALTDVSSHHAARCHLSGEQRQAIRVERNIGKVN